MIGKLLPIRTTRSRVTTFAMLVSIAALVAILVFGTRPAFAASSYTVQDLGTLGSNETIAHDINDSGQVVGNSYLANRQSRAFLWEDGQMQNLGTLSGGSGSVAFGINGSGQVAGSSNIANGQNRAFLWENGQMQNLGTLGGGFSQAWGVNDSGQVTGTSTVANGQTRAFLWENGQMQNLGTLGGGSSEAYGINDSGQVAGISTTADGQQRAFLWENGQMQNLGIPSGQSCEESGCSASQARDINDSGQVVGYWGLVADGREILHAFLWEDGQMQDLAPLDPERSFANGINNAGRIVGYASTPEYQYASLWENGQMENLNDLIPADSGWDLLQANDINSSGRIVGWGRKEGNGTHAFVLTPDTLPEDVTDPTADITTPADGATYARGQEISADFSCEDEPGGSGIASCEGTVPDGSSIDTSTPGNYDFVVEATDNAGNQSSVTHTYTVSVSECTVLGTPDVDTLDGTTGDDVICGLGGKDTIRGLGGNDTLRGDGGVDLLLGGAGDDRIDGGTGAQDRASFEESPAAVVASLVANTATGEGSDTLSGIENLEGSAFNDTLTGSDGFPNRLTGLAGADNLSGLAENDTLRGNGGADTLSGGDDADSIVGLSGPDKLFGDNGDDTLDSRDNRQGNDDVDGGANTDACSTDATERSVSNCES